MFFFSAWNEKVITIAMAWQEVHSLSVAVSALDAELARVTDSIARSSLRGQQLCASLGSETSATAGC